MIKNYWVEEETSQSGHGYCKGELLGCNVSLLMQKASLREVDSFHFTVYLITPLIFSDVSVISSPKLKVSS